MIYQYENLNKGNPQNYVFFLEMANIRQTILPPVRVYQVDGLQSVCFMSLDDSGRLFVGDGMGRVVSTNTHGNNALISLGSLPDNCVVHHTVRNGVVYYTYWNGETCGIKKKAPNANSTDFIIQNDDEHGTEWKPISIHASRINEDILIGMTAKKGAVGRVIRCNSAGTKQREIFQDNDGQHVYRYPRYITEPSNGHIWVSDSDNNAIKIEADRRYPGAADPGFGPKGICTDVDDHIIVCVANKVQLFDTDVQQLRVLPVDNEGDNASISVCVDRDRFLHVGYSNSNVVKVYKYLE